MQYPEFFAAILLALYLAFAPGEEQSFSWPAWFHSPASMLLQQFPEKYLEWINRSLIYANRRSNRAFAEFASAKLCLFLAGLFSSIFVPTQFALLASIPAYFLPDLFLSVAIKKRQEQIRKALPQALDLMVLCVDAGLGLDATMQKISTDSSGLATALNDELKILGREILLGMDREKAYQDLFARTGVDELKTLGSALHQASKLGLSVAKILRAQSDFICKKHSQRAEESAQKMPIYMAFPLWFFIMPCLLLLVLGPALLRFYHQLHGGMM
jgi:tight adherence protein C